MESSERNTPYDWALLAAAIAATLPFIGANLSLIVFHRRSYFKAQGGVALVVGSSVAGLVWIYTCFLNHGHFTRPSFFSVCVLWTFWSQGLGICLWFTFNLVRLHRIYLLSREEDGWRWGYLVLAGFLMLPLVVFSILVTKYDVFYGPCNMKKVWNFTIWTIVYSIYVSVSVIFLCMLRGETDPLFVTERTRTSEYLTMALIIVLASGNAVLTDLSHSVSGRCFLTFSTCSLVFLHFWSGFGWPVYLCLFRPKSDMERLEQELSQLGARALQVMSAVYTQRAHLQSSEGAVLEAFSKATQEVEDIKDRIKKLEQTKRMLEEENQELELRRNNKLGLMLSIGIEPGTGKTEYSF